MVSGLLDIPQQEKTLPVFITEDDVVRSNV